MFTDEKLMRLLLRDAGLLRRASGAGAANRIRGGAGILSHLKKGEGKTQQALADEIGIRAQSVSEALSVLEEKGYICRTPSESDRRAMLIYITDSGEVFSEEITSERKERAERFFSALSDGEKEMLGEILIKLRDRNLIENKGDE